MDRRLGTGRRRVLGGILVLALVAGVQCGGKSEAEIASELLARGLEAHVAGDLDEAADAYREVLLHEPQNKFAYYNLGLIDQVSGQAPEAEANYRRALNSDPAFVPALFNLAILRANAGATNEAIGLYRRAIAADPLYAASHFNLGLLLRAVGQESEGEEEIARAIRLDPTLASRVPPEPSEPSDVGGLEPAESVTPSPD